MAGSSVDSLNFKVILNDNDFKKAVESDIKLAEKLNTRLTNVLNLKKKLNSETTQQIVNAEKVKQAEQKTAQAAAKVALEQQKIATEAERTKRAAQGHAGSVGTLNSRLLTTRSLMQTLSQLTGVAFGVIGIRRFLSSLIGITGQFEVQRMALRNMLQDIDGAEKIYEDLYRFSSDSTYRFSELAKYAKQLAAFNIGKDSLLETTKMLGDVASGVGVSMDRVILAYGHVKSSGFLRGIQLRSFSQNGIPVLEELSKMFTEIEGKAVSLGDVFDKMMKREIPFEMVEEAFKRMTSEGGKFYQMQEVLAKTLAGQINILKGRWENMLAAIGQANSGPLKDAVSSVSNLISNYENVGKLIKEMVVAYGAYRVALTLITASQYGVLAATTALTGGLVKLEAAMVRNKFAILAAAITSVAYAIYKLNTYQTEAEKITDAVTNSINKYQSALAIENAELERLYARLKLAKEGTDEYDKAKREIQKRFGPYLDQLQAEGVAVDNLADVYSNLADKIRDAQKAKFMESESDYLTKSFQSASDEIYKSFKKTADALGWSIAQQEDIWRYIATGELTNKNYSSELSRSGGGTIGVPGTFTYKDFGRSPELLRKMYSEAAKAYDDGMNELERVLGSHKKSGTANGETAADEIVYSISSIVAGIKKYDADIKQLRDKAKAGSITDEELKRLKNLVEARKEQTDLYKEILGVDYDKETKPKTEKKEKDELEEELDRSINALANQNIKRVEEETKNLLDNIEAREKAMKEWLRFLDDLGVSGRQGVGAEYDISVALENYDKASREIDTKFLKRRQGFSTLFGVDSESYNRNMELLNGWKAIADSSNMATLADKIQSASKTIFNEGMAGYDLTNFSDKSLSQILQIEDALENLDIPEPIKELLKDYPELLALLQEALKDLAKGKLDKTITPEKFKKIAETAKDASEMVMKLADALKVAGEAKIGNGIYEIAEGLSGIATSASDAMDSYSKFASLYEKTGGADGWMGKIFSSGADAGFAGSMVALTLAANMKALELAASQAQKEEQILDGLRSMYRTIRSKDTVRGSMFGTSQMDELTQASDRLNQIRSDMAKYKDEIDTFEFTETHHGFWEKAFGWMHEENWSGVGAFSGKLLPDEMQRLADIEGVFDKYGNLDADVLRSILETYPDLTEEERNWIERAIADSEAYAEAIEEMEGVLADVYGDIASTAADTIIDSWIEAGDAALDYANILDDVARRYAKMLIQDAILKKVLTTERADEIAGEFLNGNVDTAMGMISEDMQKIANMAPVFEQILSSFDPYFISESESESGSSLGAGIKSITEETASLLASYLNAVRADVSYMRGLQERGLEQVSLIGGMLPTLNNYLAQVSANTFDTAQSNQQILSEIQSVIGAQGTDGMVVRVQMA